MSNAIIGLDMDGVIIDHTDIKKELAAQYGVAASDAETASDIYRTLFERDTYNTIQNLMYDDPDIALRPPLMPGARQALERLAISDAPYYLISRRLEPIRAIELLEKRGIWPSLLNEDNAFFVRTPSDKNRLAKQLSITHYVDDTHKVLDALEAVEYKALFDSVDAFVDDARYKRLTNWDEVLAFIGIS